MDSSRVRRSSYTGGNPDRYKCYVLLSNLIKDLTSQTTKQFLGVAKQIKALDDKQTSLDKIVYELGALVAHIKKDACWTKAYLEKEDEEDESENEKEKKEVSDSEKTESENGDDKAE